MATADGKRSPVLIRGLFWGAVVFTVVMAGSGFLALVHSRIDAHRETADNQARRRQEAFYALVTASQFRHSAYTLLQTVAATQKTLEENRSVVPCQGWLERVSEATTPAHRLVMADIQGKILCATSTANPVLPAPGLEERLLAGRALASRGLVSRVVPAEKDGRKEGKPFSSPRYLLALPWDKEDEAPEGVLLAELDIGILAQALTAVPLRDGEALALMDGAGTLLLAHATPLLPLETVSALLAAEGMSLRLRQAEGTPSSPLTLSLPDSPHQPGKRFSADVIGLEEGREGLRALILAAQGPESLPRRDLWLLLWLLALLAGVPLWLEERRRRQRIVATRQATDHATLEQMKASFAAAISHELRTPLTAIRAALGMINSGRFGALPAEARELSTIAAQSAERLVQQINDILDLEKVTTGALRVDRRPLALAPLLTQAVAEIQPEARAAQVPVTVVEPLYPVDVRADAERLLQIFSGLLANAIKFSPAGSPVTISMRRPPEHPDQVVVDVRDCGPGIPEHFRPRLFAPFSQADAVDPHGKGGVGLGLSLIRGLVEHFGGAIAVSSAIGRGTTFHVTLPVWPPRGEGGFRTLPAVAIPVPAAASPAPRLLVCEDDPFVARLLCTLLERAGFSTVWVATASEARQCLSHETFAAMTLDLQLPDVSGLTLLRQLRDDPQTRALPVIVVAAAAEAGRAQLRGEAVGVVDWLGKPVDRQRLLAAVQRALLGAMQETPETGAPARRLRILHVEDDLDLRATVERLLGSEMDVVAAASLAEARLRAMQETFDLAVIDTELPDGSGLDVIPLLKNACGHTLPVVVFSAADPVAATLDRVTTILVKSRASHQELVATIRSLVIPSGHAASCFALSPAKPSEETTP